jgi:hypothetical protein
MQIVVNGTPKTVPWGSLLATVAIHPRHVALLRHYKGRLTAVPINADDLNALRLPLLPGDHVTWE